MDDTIFMYAQEPCGKNLSKNTQLYIIKKQIFDSHEKCVYVAISVRPASQLSTRDKNFSVAIFSDTMNMINVKLRMVVVLSEFTH